MCTQVEETTKLDTLDVYVVAVCVCGWEHLHRHSYTDASQRSLAGVRRIAKSVKGWSVKRFEHHDVYDLNFYTGIATVSREQLGPENM